MVLIAVPEQGWVHMSSILLVVALYLHRAQAQLQ